MPLDVRLDGVSRRYRNGGQDLVALQDVTLTIAAGEAVAVQGPSGSGKSTLLHVIGAMDQPDEGVVSVGGLAVNRLGASDQAAYRRRIGFVFQQFLLIPALTALDNVVAPLIPFKTAFDPDVRGRALLESVGLAGSEGAYPTQLSGGEQQRVAIARALINDPGMVLADEPTGNLDSSTTDDIMELLMDVRAKRGMTMLIATHDPLAAACCERIITLRDGRVADDIPVRASSPEEDEIARLFGLSASE